MRLPSRPLLSKLIQEFVVAEHGGVLYTGREARGPPFPKLTATEHPTERSIPCCQRSPTPTPQGKTNTSQQKAEPDAGHLLSKEDDAKYRQSPRHLMSSSQAVSQLQAP
jgi:hypothetical protein